MESKTSKYGKMDTEKPFRGFVFLLFLAGAFTSSMSLIPVAFPIEKTFICVWFSVSLILVLLLSSSTLGVFIIPLFVLQLGYVFEEMAIKLADNISKGTFSFMFLAFYVITTPIFFLVSSVGMSSSKKIRDAVQNSEAENAALSRLI